MGSLSLWVLGSFDASLYGRLLGRFRTRSVQALLIYLACQPATAQRREHLMSLLWPGLPQQSAQANLRQTLYLLRRAIPEVNTKREGATVPLLLADRQFVQVNPEANYELDCLKFDDLISEGGDARAAAVELYRGHFLEDFYLPDSAAFEEWTLAYREKLRRKVLWVLEELAAEAMATGSYEEAVHYARRQIVIDSLSEPAHQQLMEALARDGRRAEALAEFEALAELLMAELAVTPSPESEMLADSIRDNALEQIVEIVAPVQPGGVPELPRLMLPADRTPFVGREKELDQLDRLLSAQDGRLVTIVGPGGMGKTRLARAAALRQVGVREDRPNESGPYKYSDGVFFVPLEDLTSEDQLVMAIMSALELKSAGGLEPKTQLLNYLAGKRLLLVLDNFEQLIGIGDLPTAMLDKAKGMQLLVTSREKLSLHGEQLYPLSGLECGDPFEAAAAGPACRSAPQLFVQCATRLRPDFSLGPGDGARLDTICRLVGGMPLALELAAGWVNMLSLAEIVDELEKGLDFLESDLRDIPERHRSMMAVFETTWSRLEPPERLLFSQLSIFRGGFTRQAAEEITGASYRQLADLINRSLAQYDHALGRYQIHPLLRQFGAERVAADLVMNHEIRSRHCRYYCKFTADWLQRWDYQLKTSLLSEMEIDFKNVRLAWEWAITNHMVDEIVLAFNGLLDFCNLSGHEKEGANTVSEAYSILSKSDAPFVKRKLAVVLALLGGKGYRFKLLSIDKGLSILEELESAGTSVKPERLIVLMQSAWLTYTLGNLRESVSTYCECLELCEELEDWDNAGTVHQCLALINRVQGLYEEGIHNALESARYFEMIGARADKAIALTYIADIYRAQGRFEDALCILETEAHDLIEDDTSFLKFSVYDTFLGLAYLSQGDYERTEHVFHKAFLMAEDAGAHVKYVSYFLEEFAKTFRGYYGPIDYSAGNEFDLLEFWPVGTNRVLLRNSWKLIIADRIPEAIECLERCVEWNARGKKGDDASLPYVWLAVAYRFQDRSSEAAEQLHKALSVAIEIGSIYPVMHGLPAAALSLVDLGQHERAVEVYEAALQFPHVANAQLFEDMVGKHIKELEATLPTDVVAEAKTRGRAADPWQVTAELTELFAAPGDLAFSS